MAKCKNCKHLGYLFNGDQVGERVWCRNITDSPDMEIERDCEHYSPITNADRIRIMTDEELAEFLREFLIDNNHEPDTSELYEWLRAESEG